MEMDCSLNCPPFRITPEEEEEINTFIESSAEHGDFLRACWKGKDDEVRKILESDPAVAETKEQIRGLTPLHLAVIKGHTQVLDILLNEGYKSPLDGRCRTPLDLSYSGEVHEGDCFHKLSEHIDDTVRTVIEEMKEVESRSCRPDDILKIWRYIIREKSHQPQDSEYSCILNIGNFQVILFSIGSKSHFCLDRHQTFQGRTKIRIDCSSIRQGERPELIAFACLKVFSTWINKNSKGASLSTSNGQEQLEKHLLETLRDKDISVYEISLLAIENDIRQTVLKLNLCMDMLKQLTSLTGTEVFSSPKAAVAFLKFLETFAALDFHYVGLPDDARRSLAGGKKKLFEVIFPKKPIKVIREIRIILFDRSDTKTLNWPEIIPYEQTLKTFIKVAAASNFFQTLFEFTAEGKSTFENTSSDASNWKTDLLGVLESGFQPPAAQLPDSKDFEERFREAAMVFINEWDKDGNVDLNKKNQLEYDLIVNIRSIAHLYRGEIYLTRNLAAHTYLLTEDIASCLFDYYRRHLAEGVFSILQTTSNSKAKLDKIKDEQEKKRAMDELKVNLEKNINEELERKNKDFSSIAVWYSFSSTKSGIYSRNDYNGVVSDFQLTPPLIDLYLKFIAVLLVEENNSVREGYLTMDGKAKRELLLRCQLNDPSQEISNLFGNFVLSTAAADTWVHSINKLIRDTLKALENILSMSHQFHSLNSWVDMAALYTSFVEKQGENISLEMFPRLKDLERDPDRRKDVEGVLRNLYRDANPATDVLAMSKECSKQINLADIVADLLSLKTGNCTKAELLLRDPRAVFSDTKIIHYLMFPQSKTVTPPKRIQINYQVLNLACEIPYMAPFATSYVSYIPEEGGFPTTFEYLTMSLLSTDGYARYIYCFGDCRLSGKIMSKFFADMLKSQCSPRPEAITAVLKISATTSFEQGKLPKLDKTFFEHALPVFYDLIEQKDTENASRLIEKMIGWPESAKSEKQLCNAWLCITEEEIMQKLKTEWSLRSLKLTEALGYLAVKTYNDPILKMMAMSMEGFLYGKLSYYDKAAQIYDGLWRQFWKYVLEDSPHPPCFSGGIAKCLSSENYKALLAKNHHCRRMLNIFQLKTNIAWVITGLAKSCPKEENFKNAAAHYYELLHEDHRKDWSTQKFGSHRVVKRLAEIHKQLGTLCGSKEELFHRAKSNELLLLQRKILRGNVGDFSPRVKEPVHRLKENLEAFARHEFQKQHTQENTLEIVGIRITDNNISAVTVIEDLGKFYGVKIESTDIRCSYRPKQNKIVATFANRWIFEMFKRQSKLKKLTTESVDPEIIRGWNIGDRVFINVVLQPDRAKLAYQVRTFCRENRVCELCEERKLLFVVDDDGYVFIMDSSEKKKHEVTSEASIMSIHAIIQSQHAVKCKNAKR